MSGQVNPQDITQFGQTATNDVALITVFGWLITEDGDVYIPNLADRAVGLLIEEFRLQYGAG